jgi:hypothetical protein
MPRHYANTRERMPATFWSLVTDEERELINGIIAQQDGEPLLVNEQTVLFFCVWYNMQYGVPPSLHRIKKELGYRGATYVYAQLRRLVKKGRVIHIIGGTRRLDRLSRCRVLKDVGYYSIANVRWTPRYVAPPPKRVPGPFAIDGVE